MSPQARANDAVVFGKQLGIQRVADAPEEHRRILDVGEEKSERGRPTTLGEEDAIPNGVDSSG
jgi:hypothetical protein